MAEIEGIIFDMDNTLVLSEELHYKAIKKVTDQLNIQIDWELYEHEFLGKDIEAIFMAILAFARVKPTKPKVDRLIEEKKQALEDVLKTTKPKVVPGIDAFLKQVQAAKIPMTIASNSMKSEIEQILFKTGLIDYFKKIVSFESVTDPKPNPEIFVEAARLLTADIKRCVIFEDSGEGLAAAKKSKAFVVGLTTTLPEAGHILLDLPKSIPDYRNLELTNLKREFSTWVDKNAGVK